MTCGMPADGDVGASNAARSFTWAGSTMVMSASGPISMRRVMLDASLAEVAACGIDGLVNAVLFVVIDADEGGGFGDDGRWCMGWSAHGTATVANLLSPRK